MVMPGRKFDAGSLYRYGFNGKENDNEVKGDGNQQDYGMRIYDPRLGKFFSADPLVGEFPELTPYQFASNRPIDGIDLDGLEYSKAQLQQILSNAKAKLGVYATESSIALRGFANANVNALSGGITDNIPFINTANLDDYDNDYDKSIYLYGRILGDVSALLIGTSVASGGTTAMAIGATASGTGVGAVVGAPTALAGAVTTTYGAAVITAATVDLGWALNKLAGLEGAVDNSKNIEKSPEQSTNSQATSANNKYGGGIGKFNLS